MAMKAQERLAAFTLALRYLAFAALIALAGVAFGWRVPVAVGLLLAALWLRIRIDTRWPKGLHPNKLVVTLDLLASGILGAIIGGLLFGGAFGLLGCAMGVAISLATLPLSTKNADGVRVPLTLQGSPATARRLTILGFLLPVIVLAVCVLLLVAR
ncbi:MAG: hypothetical protein M3P18_14410 [Actinomycetota bacterium]|nr:hypothetical protein [Actinomycetota bacterium]